MKPRREIENLVASMGQNRLDAISALKAGFTAQSLLDGAVRTVEVSYQTGIATVTLEVLLDIRDLLQREAS